LDSTGARELSARHTLLELFDAALRAVDGRASVRNALVASKPSPVAVFAIGKAASAMVLGARDALGNTIESIFVVTKDGHVDPQLRDMPRVTIHESAHPVPDARSLAAGEELVTRVASLTADLHPLFLISGGSSSLIEALRDGVTLDDLRSLNQRGLRAGWSIEVLNAERQKLSRLKSGGIARLLGTRPATALFISDVAGDDPDVIGSGLLGSAKGHPDGVTRVVVANVEFAVNCTVNAALARGLRFERCTGRFDGEASHVASEFVAALRDCPADGLVWGGESTVKLPERHGRGGRNTHLALAAARLLRPAERLTILSAGTDGTDGPTLDAGAIVDPSTTERAELAGCDVEQAFREFDSGTVLEMSEDLLHTGPTGTNVGDLLIGIKGSANSLRGRVPAHML
jgi:glycerate 2-kinase